MRAPAAGHVTVDATAVPLRPRTVVALVVATVVGLLAFTWPLLVSSGSTLAGDGAYAGAEAPLVLAVVLVTVLVVLGLSIAEGGLDVKAVAVLGMLAAVGAVLRPLSAGTAGVELVFLVVLLGGRVFGAGFGFALGATTLFSSALLTGGVGPWLPYQMLGAAWLGCGAGLLPRARGWAEVVLMATYGAIGALAYGFLINLPFWPFQLGGATGLSFVAGGGPLENLSRYAMYVAVTSLGWDVGRAVTMVVGVAVLGRPVLRVLRRASRRAVFTSGTDTRPRQGAPAVPGSPT